MANLLPAEITDAISTLNHLSLTQESQSESTTTSGSNDTDHPVLAQPKPSRWNDVTSTAKLIADSLRSENLRTEIGKTGVIQACAVLLQTSEGEKEGVAQLLRIVGNLCFDHDCNRQLSLDAQIPQAIIKVLSSAVKVVLPNPAAGAQAGRVDENQHKSVPLEELYLVRAGVGALLNLSLGFEPIKITLRSLPAATILLLSILDNRTLSPLRRIPPIYALNSWAAAPPKIEKDEELWKEKLLIGSTVASWSMTILEDILEKDKSIFPASGVASLVSLILFSQEIPFVLPTVSPFLPTDLGKLLKTDLELLSQSSSLLESLAIDSEVVKWSLCFGGYEFSELPVSFDTILSRLFTFIEWGKEPISWVLWDEQDEDEEEDDDVEDEDDDEDGEGENKKESALEKKELLKREREKLFSLVKASVIKSVVECPNSDTVMNSLFDFTNGGKNWVVEQLIRWIDPSVGLDEDDEEELERIEPTRDDLLICATHMLAALGRKDENCIALVQTYELAPPLVKLLKLKVSQQLSKEGKPGEVTQVLFGVVSLLRHLAIPQANKLVLTDTGIVSAVSPLLSNRLDIVTPLQNAVVGLLKHLVVSNVHASLEFVETSALDPSPLSSVLSLISRTEDVRLRSEATRILVNVVRTFFSGSATPDQEDEIELRSKGREKVVKKEVVEPLSEMIRLSEKYPLLINEGIVGLTLLAGSGPEGALLVLLALLEPHRVTPSQSEPDNSLSSVSSTFSSNETPARKSSLAITAAGDPPCSSDMLVTWLGLAASKQLGAPASSTATTTKPNSTVRPEMVANVCVLLVTVLRKVKGLEEDNKISIDLLMENVVGPLGGVGIVAEGNLRIAAIAALDAVEGRD